MRAFSKIVAVCATFILAASVGYAQNAATQDLAKNLSNPVASLISVPFQFNYDKGFGPNGNGSRTSVNIQPVVPFSIGENWNVISRTIVPIVTQTDVIPGTTQSGLGDIAQSFFFSPKAPTPSGIIWGAGPIFLLPTATSPSLGLDQFAAGPTGVALVQSGPWTYGALGNHLWDVGGGSTKINATFIQPFLSYMTPETWTFSVNTESTYDWEADQWSVPVNFSVTKLVSIADQPVSVGGGIRYWAKSPAGGADGWGARMIVTFLFPK
jgi:hypothetical protein